LSHAVHVDPHRSHRPLLDRYDADGHVLQVEADEHARHEASQDRQSPEEASA